MSRKGKMSHCDARAMLERQGVDFSEDFHALPSSKVDLIVEAARAAGYRKRRDAPGSRGRMYFQLLSRQKGCRR